MRRVLVYGLGITGRSVARALSARGVEVVVSDDDADSAQRCANELGIDAVTPTEAVALATDVDMVSPAPGVPETHPVIAAAEATGVEVWSELEIAYRWEQERPGGPRPMIAITATDGKTTTTNLCCAMLNAAGHRAEPLGNTETPLIDVVADASAGPDEGAELDVLVVECSSFRLRFTETFRADAAGWLNQAPDHLNWHIDLAAYEAAKARIFDLQSPGDTSVGFIDDPVVMSHLADSPGRRRTFGMAGADYRFEQGVLVGPAGPITEVERMRRRLPHDVTNALAASALVLERGLASPAQIAEALASFEGPAHRLEYLGAADGVEWYNDSKATTPHAAVAAIGAFDSIVLIAGGSRKGVDLSEMGTVGRDRVKHVVAIGDAADDIVSVFGPVCGVERASDLADAVDRARSVASEGDVVLLSPGCASFDQFQNYEHRGDEFRRLVTEEVL